MKPAQIEDETQIVEESKLQCTPCTDAVDDIPLDNPEQQAPLPENADLVVLLTTEKRFFDELKSYCWMTVDS